MNTKKVEEVGRELKFLLYVGLFFLLSGVASIGEFRYRVFGRTAEATISGIVEKDGSEKQTLAYRFTEESGEVRTESYDVPADFVVPDPAVVGGEPVITVEYVPGVKGASRPEGRGGVFAIAVFLALLIYFSYRLWSLIRKLRSRQRSGKSDSDEKRK